MNDADDPVQNGTDAADEPANHPNIPNDPDPIPSK